MSRMHQLFNAVIQLKPIEGAPDFNAELEAFANNSGLSKGGAMEVVLEKHPDESLWLTANNNSFLRPSGYMHAISDNVFSIIFMGKEIREAVEW